MNIAPSYVTLWKGEINERGFYKGQISESRKDKDGNYINSNYNLIANGEAAKMLASLPERTRLLIKNGRIENVSFTRSDGTKDSFPSVTVFKSEDFEVVESNGSGNAKPAQPKPAPAPVKPKPQPVDDFDDGLPF